MSDNEQESQTDGYNLKFEYDLTKEQFEQISDAIAAALDIKPKDETEQNRDSECVTKTKVIGRRTVSKPGTFVPQPGHGIPFPTPGIIKVTCTTYQSTTVCPHNTTYVNTWEECDG